MAKSSILILISWLLASLSLGTTPAVVVAATSNAHLRAYNSQRQVTARQQQQQPGLHSLAQAAGKLFFGTATDTNNFNDTAYMQIVNNRNEFGLLVPENSQKWQPTEPTQGNFVFTGPDQVRALATTNGQMFRCHTLTWFQQLPQFVLTTSWTAQTLTAVIQTHITNVVGHYAGACYSWDVVNEALNDGNGTFRTSVFFNTLGTEYIPLSFRAAAAADPRAKLYYNDFSLEFNGSKTNGAVDIVRLVQNATAAAAAASNSTSGQGLMQGVGFQGHFTVGGTPSQDQLVSVFNRFLSLPGIQEIAITELDIRHSPGTVFPANASAQEQQARDYMSVVGACLAVGPRCVGIVVWQFTDKYSWVPSTFTGAGEACLYDAGMVKKPAWTSVSAQLAAAATAAATAAAGVGGSGSLLPNASSVPTGVAARPTGALSSGAGNGNTSLQQPTSGLAPSGPVQVAGSDRVVERVVGSPLLVALLSLVLSVLLA